VAIDFNFVSTCIHSDIVQTPLAVPAAVRAHSSTPFSDGSRPGTPLSGESVETALHFL